MLKEDLEQRELGATQFRGGFPFDTGRVFLTRGTTFTEADFQALHLDQDRACGDIMARGARGKLHDFSVEQSGAARPFEVDYVQSFVIAIPVLDRKHLDAVIYQSGRRPDTIAALREDTRRREDAGICNVCRPQLMCARRWPTILTHAGGDWLSLQQGFYPPRVIAFIS